MFPFGKPNGEGELIFRHCVICVFSSYSSKNRERRSPNHFFVVSAVFGAWDEANLGCPRPLLLATQGWFDCFSSRHNVLIVC